MTSPNDSTNPSEPWLLLLGELTARTWTLRQGLREMGRAWGSTLERLHHSAAVHELRTRIADDQLPAWFSSQFSVSQTLEWLDDVERALDESDRFVEAIAAHPTDPQTFEPQLSVAAELTSDAVTNLIEEIQACASVGDSLLSETGLELASGAKQYGYHAIARSLHTTLMEESNTAETIPVKH